MDKPYTSVINTSSVPLLAGETFVGRWEEASLFASVITSCKSDVLGSLYLEFSDDNEDLVADSSLMYNVDAGINEVHRLTVSRKWFRVRYVNGPEDQTYLSLSTILGNQSGLSSPLNLNLGQDADAIAVRSIPAELDIAQGKLGGFSKINKLGKNSDINSNSVPEFVTEGGGVYAGFPTGAPEELTALSSAGDTGTLYFLYLASSDSETWQLGSVVLTGTTPANTGISAYRAHSMWYDSGSETAFNIGTLTLRHRITTSNVFLTILPGVSQSNYAVYTVPAGHTAYMVNISAGIRRGTSAAADGAVWARTFGNSPRYRRPFTVSQASSYSSHIYGGTAYPEKTDISLVITFVSVNSVSLLGGFDLILIKD